MRQQFSLFLRYKLTEIFFVENSELNFPMQDVNDEIPLFTEREQETVMEGEPVGTPVTR